MLKEAIAKGVLTLTISRPEARNAIDQALATALQDALTRASEDSSLRVVVLRSEGPVFLAGGDLKELRRHGQSSDGPERVLNLGTQLAAIERCSLPVIAAVHGDVFGGGCELLMMCDQILMEEHAQLHFVHAKMGLVPAWGGVTRLLERTGRLGAGELLLRADPMNAKRAQQLGLCNAVVPTGTVGEAAQDLATRIARHPRSAVVGLKAAIQKACQSKRGDALEREQPLFRELFQGDAHRQVMAKL
jgi:enoyl-CoA hydratase/carnithine racemase